MMRLLKWVVYAALGIVAAILGLAAIFTFAGWAENNPEKWRDILIVVMLSICAGALLDIRRLLQRISNQIAQRRD